MLLGVWLRRRFNRMPLVVMKRAVKLTEEEDLTLQQLSVNHKHRDIRTRAAGIMLLGSGISPLDTLGAALKRAGFSYKRGRYSLKKTQRAKVRLESQYLGEITESGSRWGMSFDLPR